MKLDLDARRAEAAGEAHEVVIGGETYELPPVFPMVIAEYLGAMRVSDAIAALFGEEAVETIAPLLSDDDLNAIMEDLYHLSQKAEEAAAKASPTIPTTGRESTRRNGKKPVAATSRTNG